MRHDCIHGTVHRNGLTLIEAVVCMAIIGIVSAISFLAVQHSREASRVRTCQNNLRQIGIATLSFESARSRLPAGTLGYANAVPWNEWRNVSSSRPYWRYVPHTSFWVLLLPYLEMSAAQDKVQVEMLRSGESLVNVRNSRGEIVSWFGNADGFSELSQSSFPALFCPSDSLNTGNTGQPEFRIMGGSQPVITRGTNDAVDALDNLERLVPHELVSSNYLGCAGAHSGGIHPDPERHSFRGAMSSGEMIGIRNLVDGTSNVILAGETIGRWRNGKRRRAQLWTVGGLSRMRGDVPWKGNLGGLVNPTQIMIGTRVDAAEVGFGSMHPGGASFVYVDGSVAMINRETDWKLLYRLAGIASSRQPDF